MSVSTAKASIADLEETLAGLSPEARACAARIFLVSSTVGNLVSSVEMEAWITKLFGSVDAVREQRIARVL